MKEPKRHDMRMRAIGGRQLRPESLMMGYGYRPDWSQGALKSPIFQTSTFVFETAEEGKAFFEVAYGLREAAPAENLGLIYSRLNNPDLEILEDRLALWEDCAGCAVFQSGMAAIATTLLTFLRPGGVVVHSEPIYGGTHYLLHQVLADLGIGRTSFPAGCNDAELEEALRRGAAMGRLRVVFLETPANPTNRMVDIARVCELAREVTAVATSPGGPERGGAAGPGAPPAAETDGRALVLVDNTFLGPLFQHPLEHGADLVLYSLTKYVGGHSDLIAGACLGPADLMGRVRGTRTFLGTMAGPWSGWLLMRSLETLKLRMTSQMKNARYVADFLAGHPKVERVHYLGHLEEGDAQFDVYCRQCLAAGGMISFEVEGGEEEAFRFLDALSLVRLAVSLGGTESLAEHPATMTHADVEPEEQARMGITPAMVRLSIGVENPQDLIADLERALEAV